MSNVFVFRQPPHGVITEYFGGGKGGSTTTTNNVTQIPPEVLARYNAVNARAETVAQQPYQAYSNDPNAFVAPLNATQQAGIQNTNIMAGAAQPFYGAATDQLLQAQAQGQAALSPAYQNVAQAQNIGGQLGATAAQQYGGAQDVAAPYYQQATQGTQAALQAAQPYQTASTLGLGAALSGAQPFQTSAAQGTQAALQAGQPYQGMATQAALAGAQAIDPSRLQIGRYMSPFTQNVVNATQAALGQQFGQQRAQQQAEAIRSGAFGGDRAGLQRAALQGQQALAASQAIAPLYQQAYNQALQTAQQQQGVGLGAAQANRAALQQAGQQLAALGQQGFGQNLSAAQQMAALGQQGFGQQANVAQQLAALGQQTYGQQLGAANQLANLGQGLYGQQLGVGQALQGLGQQQYGQGMTAAQQLAALGQQGYGMGSGTSAALAGLGTNAQQAGLAGAQAQLAAGQAQQQTQQAGLQAMYNQFLQQQGFPYQQAQFLANIATGTGALSGNASSGTSTTTGGGGFFSDERLKENIKKVGETNDGQPIYRYNYKGDQRTQIGLLAQDVEKDHPEAVGLAGGYKTVDYKKATEDAIHKEDGGALSGTDAYSIGAPSAMLRENSGKGLGAMPSLPQMITGPQRIEAGANAAQLAALRAPQATGYSLGTREGKEAELASLQSSLLQPPGPNGDLLGSGPQYLQSRISTLQDWLNKNQSQGGLVSGPGNFARGGLADGGYMNPALAYYSPQQAQQGVFQLQPMPQRQILQGTPMQAPPQRQQPDAITSAMNMAKLVEMGDKARPDFLRSAADVAARQRTADALAAREQQYIDWAKEKGYPLPSDAKAADKTGGGGDDLLEGGDDFARGGYAGKSYVNPYGGLGGGNDILGPIIEQQDTSLRIPGDKGTPAPSSKPQQPGGGIGSLVQAGLGARSALKGGEWAAGKLGLTGPETAMSATSTEALPSVAGGVVPEAVAPVVPEAVTAAAPEALTAGLAGAETVAAPVAMAAAEGVADLAPLLFFLKNGGAVPRRHHFEDGGFESGTSQILPADPAFDPNFDEPQPLRQAPVVRRGVAPPLETTAVAATPRTTEAPAPRAREPEAPRAREPGVASSYLPDFSKIVPEGAKDTLSSENFWVPALAGIGAMLASPNKTLAGAIGSGLVGGTTAYTGLEKQNADILKQRFELAKDVFEGPIKDKNGQWVYRDNRNGEMIPMSEYGARRSAFMAGKDAPTRSAASPAVATAREVITEPAPSVSRPTAATITAQEQPTPQVAPQAQEPPKTPSAPTPVEAGQPKDLAQIKAELEADTRRWATAPPARNPILLKQQAAALSSQIEVTRRDAEEIARMAPKSTEATRLTALAEQLDKNRKELIDRADAIINDAAGLAYKQQETLAAGSTAQAVGRGQVPTAPDVLLPEGKTVAQAENDPDYLGSRIESNMKKYNELKARGALEEANKYLAAADKDRDRLEKVIGTEYTTPEGTKYSVHPNAEVFNVTQPKSIPKEYKANIDPNTGVVVSKPVGEFIGYPETGGHPVSPALIGKKAVIKGEGDKRLLASKAQSDELEKAFVGGAEKAQDGIDTIIKFSTAAKVLESKGTNMQRAELANFARGLGFNAIADQFMSGQDTSAAFTALKTNVDQAINQVTNNFARPTQAEFLITEKKATPSLDMPVDAAHSLAQTRLAGLMWQNAILSDWETAKRETGSTNFAAFRDVWQKAHPKALFEEAADRALGNFKGQNLPKPEKFTEGVVYVVPKNAGDTQVGRALIGKGLRPGDLFVMNGVNHEAKDIGEPMRVSPADAYKAHLRAPALTYGAR